MTVDPALLSRQLNWRYACKKFDTNKKIDEKTWSLVEESLILTASSYGAMPFKFIIVTNQELKNDLMNASFKQGQVADCSHHVVLLAKEQMDVEHISKYIDAIAKTRDVTLESLEGFKTMMVQNLVEKKTKEESLVWAANQVYIALGNLLTTTVLLGIDTCPMEGINKKKYNEILKLEGTGYTAVVACPCGYRAIDDKYAGIKKVRFSKDDLIIHR